MITRTFGGRAGIVAIWLVVALLASWSTTRPLQAEPPFFEYARIDPQKVVTAEKCGECHIQEAEVWKGTPHATGFKTLHRSELAGTIAGKMGFRLIKRDSLCFSCHYTPVVEDDKIRVVSGVSCESCHGAGAEYLDVHNEYGDGFDHESEPAEHRRRRIAASRRAGMRRPSDLYPVAANCFSCHTVPVEELVNKGGHTTGSSSFELVEWTQGEIRHNFLASSLEGDSAVNAERPMSRKRVMYVVGRALDLEYSVRGLAKAKTDGIYSKAMSRRVRSAVSELRAIDRSAEIPEVEDMLAAVKSARMVARNEAELLAAAEKVGKATQAFLARPPTTALASIDDLVRGIEPEFIEPEAPVAPGTDTDFELAAGSPAAGGTGIAAGGDPAGLATSSAGSTPSGASSSSARSATTGAATGAAGSSTSAEPRVAGAFKARIRPASRHRTIGPGNCAGCHTEQNEWWFSHAHSRSVDPFFDGARKNLQIARLYGVTPAQMTTGRSVCMDCHGTILSGKESREVLDGVGCESCHGPAADWLEPHKDETGKELGRDRPGHRAALAAGKVDLRQPAKRAEVCAGCHYVTESRLLSAGHPSGAAFDYVQAMGDVRHWQHRLADATIASAAGAVVASRGPVPAVRVASLPAESAGPAALARAATGRSSDSSFSSRSRGVSTTGARASERRAAEVYAIRPPAPRPVVFAAGPDGAAGADDSGSSGGSSRRAAGVELPAFPELGGATIEETLRAVQKRLKLLYRLVDPTHSAGNAKER